MRQSSLFRGAIFRPQIFAFIPENRNPIFQLPQIFISRHPEMRDFSIIIEMHLQIQIFKQQRHRVIALPDHQHIPGRIPTHGPGQHSLIILQIMAGQRCATKYQKAFHGIVHQIN